MLARRPAALRPLWLGLIGCLPILAGCGTGASERPAAARAFIPVAAAAVPVTPAAKAAAARRPRFVTARVLRPAQLRSSPGGPVVGRIGRRTEFGSPRVLSVVRRRGPWLAVHAAERPNGELGWIPAAAVRQGGTDVWVHVDRSARRLEVRRGARVLRRVTVAVGKPGVETPLGRFAVTDHLRAGSAGSPYGCCAVALTGHQPNLIPGWPGGDRLAIHGTQQQDSIGRAASLGCLRAREGDLRALMRTVPLGAPVIIEA